jgi:hypothetical protein
MAEVVEHLAYQVWSPEFNPQDKGWGVGITQEIWHQPRLD